jgi:AsmA family/AsmA-like C-terminal region
MRKFFKFILIAGGAVAALVVILVATAAIVIQVKYPPAVLKKMATDKLTEALKRKVSVGDVRFNILSGFEITQLTVSNRPGWAPGSFLSADDISISYHIFPLLWGQVSLGQVELKNFKVLVERRGATEFNFSDMASADSGTLPPTGVSAPTGAVKPAAPSKKKKKTVKHRRAEAPVESTGTSMASAFFFAQPAWAGETSAPVPPSKTTLSLSVDSVKILHGKMTYLDERTSPPQRSDLQDLNLTVKNISLVGGKSSFDLDAPFSYNRTPYQLTAQGSFRYFLASQSFQDLAVKGSLNGLAFEVSGSAKSLTENFTPDMNGEASLNMLKFSGLVPQNLSSMPDGLSLSGPAKVSFHLGGDVENGLALKGTADGSELAIQYKDLFVKQAHSPCKLEFSSVIGPNGSFYDLPSFDAIFQDWELKGSFHYRAGASYSCALHSKALPLKGISTVVPKFAKANFSGAAALDLSVSQVLGKPKTLAMSGRADLQDIGIALPNDPNLFQELNGTIVFKGSTIKLIGASFKTFEGTGTASILADLAPNPMPYSYVFALKNVSAQEAIDGWVDVAVTQGQADYKDKLYGSMGVTFQGTGKGFSTDVMEKNMAGSGTYAVLNGKVKGYPFITKINGFFKDKSDEINFDAITGTLGLRNEIFAYTGTTEGKVGLIRVNGGVDFNGNYNPNMKIQCDIHEEFVDSDAIKSQLPSAVQSHWDPSWLTDSNGNIPMDFNFTGKAKGNYGTPDFNRVIKNLENHLGDALKSTAQGAVQNLGNKLKGLFGN